MNKDYYAGMTQGRIEERERIIALLEKVAESQSDYCELPIDPEHCQDCFYFDYLIALIKRENPSNPMGLEKGGND